MSKVEVKRINEPKEIKIRWRNCLVVSVEAGRVVIDEIQGTDWEENDIFLATKTGKALVENSLGILPLTELKEERANGYAPVPSREVELCDCTKIDMMDPESNWRFPSVVLVKNLDKWELYGFDYLEEEVIIPYAIRAFIGVIEEF